MKNLIFTMFLTIIFLQVQSQDCRFLDEVFPEVQRTDNIEYGVNATILYFPVFGEAVPEQLMLDLYEPEGDSDVKRPLVIYFHSGNFLPYPQNQSPVGTRRDSSSVEFCRRMARAGYVVASADYRLGWNPLTTNPIEGTTGIINAAYRGVQDANTCIRFFKKSFVENGNPYRIDTCRIVLFGDDTGGYLSVHAGALDRYSKILESPQFWIPVNETTAYPMVIETLNGDPEGKQYGINTPPVPIFPFPAGDTLCYPNHVGYSSRFCAAVNLGGAVAEASWIEPGQPPIISMGTTYDQTTPYECGIVYVNNLPIINVCGPQGITSQAIAVGNNSASIINPVKYCSDFEQEVSAVALSRNEGLSGLMPVIGNGPSDYNPWVFCDLDEINCQNYTNNQNPLMSRENASLYIDTIMAFVLPRLYTVINLANQDKNCVVTNTSDRIDQDIDVNLFPNPTANEIRITTPEDFIIRSISLFDAVGRVIQTIGGIDDNKSNIPVAQLPTGVYLVRIQFDQGIAARQFVVQ